jgi:hypothetical protein
MVVSDHDAHRQRQATDQPHQRVRRGRLAAHPLEPDHVADEVHGLRPR